MQLTFNNLMYKEAKQVIIRLMLLQHVSYQGIWMLMA
jgi:hypothetical protein